MFQVEPRVPVRVLVDLSDSMSAYGAQKLEYARKLTAALCYVGLVRLDTMEVHGFHDRLTQRVFSTGGRHRFPGVMDGIAGMPAGGATNMMTVVREFITAYPQRGLIIMISDFLDDHDCERAIQYLVDFGHELLLLQLWSDEDRTPPWTGELDLRDAESGAALKLEFDDAARERYTRSFDEYCLTLQTLALRSGGRYVGISTSQPLDQIIFGDMVRMRGIA
jgi:uncharacterized protein (DUF58 family)